MDENADMNEKTEEICKRALNHMLYLIKNNPKVQYECGAGTQAYELLTKAAAALWDEPVDKIRDAFIPGSSAIHR